MSEFSVVDGDVALRAPKERRLPRRRLQCLAASYSPLSESASSEIVGGQAAQPSGIVFGNKVHILDFFP